MTSIVLELQKEAQNQDVSVSTLLRKALVVATKLKVKEFEEWIDNELNGYGDAEKIPEYRNTRGEVKAFNPVHGWVPVMFYNSDFAKILSARKTNQPIPSIESLLRDSDSTSLRMPYPKEVEQQILKFMGDRVPVSLFIDKSKVEGIVETVRNIVLKWSLKLEEDGIKGEQMSFSEQEKTKASNVTYNVNNFYGTVTDSQIQQATAESTQIFKKYEIDIDATKSLIKELEDNIEKVDLGDKKPEYDSEIKTIDIQIKSPNPKPRIIKESLKSIRNILQGATGSLIAYGLIYKIQEFLGTL